MAKTNPEITRDSVQHIFSREQIHTLATAHFSAETIAAHASGITVLDKDGNKLDPTAFRVADIYSTSVCPLARVMRRLCKERNIPALKVVYSTEPPVIRSREPASVSFVPSVCGLVMAGALIKDLVDFGK